MLKLYGEDNKTIMAEKRINVKKLIAILMTIAFIGVLAASFFIITTIRKVNVYFSAGENLDCYEVQRTLDGNLGKSFFFLNEQDIKDSLSVYPYAEVLSVSKTFPNVVEVSIKERQEVYNIKVGDEVLVISETGHLLRILPATSYQPSRDVINMDIDTISVTQKELGKVIATTSDQLFLTVLEMAKSVNLTDCIKEIFIDKYDAPNELSDVEFITYTGVKICVYKAEEKGLEKIRSVFDRYDEEISDYEKVSGTLMVGYDANNPTEVTWSDFN